MNTHYYKDIQGWFAGGQKCLYEYQVQCGTNESHFVEVGAWKGRSTSYMGIELLNNNKNIKFDVVDTWLGSDEKPHKEDSSVINNTLYEDFLENMKPVISVINPIKMTSIDASKLYEGNSLDFVFIDASHKYADVKDDINHWLPKVRENGMLAGDDLNWSGVGKAVRELLPTHTNSKDFFEEKNMKYGSKSIWIYMK